MNVTKKLLGKVCAIIVIVALTISDFLFVGTELTSYAIDMVKTNSSNVDFSAYFINSNGEKVEKLEKNIDMEEEYLYVDISVKNEGYFNGSISLKNNNFNLKQDILSQDIAKISGNEVKLNQINAGSTITIKLGIEAISSSTITQSILNKKTDIELTGQYVNSKNVEKDKFVEIKGTANVELAWKSSEKTKAVLDSKVLTNYIYDIDGEQKRIVQILVDSNITNNNYPVKDTKINVSIPENAKEVNVHARNVDATNSSLNFDAGNYEYNKEKNSINITLKNEDKNAISWNKNAKDSIVLTCVFDKNENVLNKKIKVDSIINTYDNKELKESVTYNISEEIDGIVSYSIENTENSIYKGKIQIGQERDYKEISKINIDYINVADEISLKAKESTFLAGDKELKANITYKQTKINKQEFLKIFGEDGFITIKDSNGVLIANINKNTEVDENGDFIISYYADTSTIEILTSKPKNLGTLNIENTKTILNDTYNKEIVKTFTGIKEFIEGNYNQKEVRTNTANIELKNTSSKVDLNVSIDKLSAVYKNENIKITTILRNNDESKDLFQNPNLEIELPIQVTNITAKCKLLYGNGLELADATIENGNIIKIKLSGTQTTYNTETLEGTTLIIYANAEVDKLATNSDEEISLSYTNEIATSIENNGIVKKPVKIVANTGVITTNNIPELNISTIGNEGIKEVELENAFSEKNASINISAINNEGAPINNVKILGKFPTMKDSNLGIKLTSGINITSDIQNVKVYYSNKEDTNNNVNDSSNEWKTEGDANSAKTYLVVIDKLNVGETFSANYTINIPENLGYNKQASLGYTIDYINDLTGAQKDAKATTLNLTTGTEAEIKTTLKAYVGGEELKENSEVKSGEIIEYNLSLKNEGRLLAENATLEVKIPDNTKLIEVNPKYPGYDENLEEYTYTEAYFIEKEDKVLTKNNIKLEPAQSINLSYMVRVESDFDKNIQAKTTSVVKYKENEVKAEFTNTLVPNNLIATIEPLDRTPNSELENKYAYSYIMEIKNLSRIAQNNVEVTINKNDLLNITGIKYYIKEDSQEVDPSKLTFTIDTIPANGTANVKIDTTVNEYTDTLTNAQISASIKNNGSVFKTNRLSEKVKGVKIEAKQEIQTSSNEDVLYPGDSVKYKITINNVGKIDANQLDIRDNYSNYLNISAVTVDGKEAEYREVPETEENNTLYIEKALKAGETSILEIIGNISEEIELDEVHEMVNQLSVYNDGILVGQTESTKNNLVNKTENDETENDKTENEETEKTDDKKNEESSNENEKQSSNSNSEENKQNNNETEGTLISGTAWYDKNEDGIKNQTEDTLQGIKATLINLKDNTSRSIETNEDGKYTFENVESGEYIVVFDYDAQKYMLTTYQADGVSSSLNSDAENVKLNINGEMLTKASTNTLKVSNTNIENIDIGLIDAKIFDLRLSKTISKVTISNSEGTQSLDYNDETLAKAEIRAKHLSGSTAIIEYKIKVTNNGEIAGYAKSIVDYKPTDLSFNSGLNKQWYQSGNKLYSTALADTLINPGETKELTLVLTKSMTESNTGLTNNIAEIAETYNTLGVENNNSTPGNKDTKETDTGSANIIISVSTGVAVSYIALTLSIITLIAIIAYIASKKILKENIKF